MSDHRTTTHACEHSRRAEASHLLLHVFHANDNFRTKTDFFKAAPLNINHLQHENPDTCRHLSGFPFSMNPAHEYLANRFERLRTLTNTLERKKIPNLKP